MLQRPVQFERDKVKKAISELAGKGVLIGTSSWKYPGWRGLLYDDARYVWHGRFSESRFERLCLAEYAEVFKTVSVDAAYYRFPDEQFWERLVADAPAEFLFSLKVTDEITIKTFPNLPRFGLRAGRANENFLNVDLFASAFLAPCERLHANIGLLIFEFSHFYPEDFAHGRESNQLVHECAARPASAASARAGLGEKSRRTGPGRGTNRLIIPSGARETHPSNVRQ